MLTDVRSDPEGEPHCGSGYGLSLERKSLDYMLFDLFVTFRMGNLILNLFFIFVALRSQADNLSYGWTPPLMASFSFHSFVHDMAHCISLASSALLSHYDVKSVRLGVGYLE